MHPGLAQQSVDSPCLCCRAQQSRRGGGRWRRPLPWSGRCRCDPGTWTSKSVTSNKPFAYYCQDTLNNWIFLSGFHATVLHCVIIVHCGTWTSKQTNRFLKDTRHLFVKFIGHTDIEISIIPHLKSICLTSLLAATTLTWRPVFNRCNSSWLERETNLFQLLKPLLK